MPRINDTCNESGGLFPTWKGKGDGEGEGKGKGMEKGNGPYVLQISYIYLDMKHTQYFAKR